MSNNNKIQIRKDQERAKQKQIAREQKLLLEFALAQKKEFLQGYLRKRGLSSSGNKDVLRERILDHIKEFKLSYEEIAGFLDTVEGWGAQSIFLYKAPDGTVDLWRRQPEAIRNKLVSENLGPLINTKKTLLLPEKATLSQINLDEKRIQFIWVEKHEWFRRDTTLDNTDNLGYELRGFRRHLERRITRFECNLETGESMLCIPAMSNALEAPTDGNRLASHSKYQKVREEFAAILEPIMNISSFTQVEIRSVITLLESSQEVMRKENVFETPEGMHFKLLSTIINKDINEDHRTKKVRDVIPSDSPGLNGSYQWLQKEKALDRNISVKLFGQEQRIAIALKCDEDEVRYVLSRIRALAESVSSK